MSKHTNGEVVVDTTVEGSATKAFDVANDKDGVAFISADPTVTFVQTFSTTTATVPAITASAPPAGGTGAAAGCWDTAGHRDAAIAAITANQADNLADRKLLNSIINCLVANGVAERVLATPLPPYDITGR